MGSFILQLIPSAIGLALTPTAIAACVLFLSSQRPIANSIAFATPFAFFYGFLAAIVLIFAEVASEPLISKEAKSIVLIVIGLTLLAIGLRLRLMRPHGRPKAPAWMAKIESAGPVTALGLGTALSILNPNVPILIGGLAIIAAADVSSLDRIVGAAFLILGAEAGMAGPIAWYCINPRKAAEGLARLKTWLPAHQRILNEAVLLIFGLVFTIHGLSGL